jgi:hypothetical protein
MDSYPSIPNDHCFNQTPLAGFNLGTPQNAEITESYSQTFLGRNEEIEKSENLFLK